MILGRNLLGKQAKTLCILSTNIIKNLRQYQLHQFKDGSFKLSVVATSPKNSVFRETIMANWNTVESARKHPLDIVEVESIFRPEGGKFQKFTSDFMPIEQFKVENSEGKQ